MTEWQKSYSDLKDYIARTPQIEIDKSFFVIPGEVRPEFNKRFDAVRAAFIQEKYPALLNEASDLSSNFTKASQAVEQSLGLSEIKLPVTLASLVNDPLGGLTRYLIDPLFNLLKGAEDIYGFERQASEAVEDSFRKVFRSAYEKWVMISLINLLAPDRGLAVEPYDLETSTHELEPDEKRGINRAEIPSPKELKTLSFDRTGVELPFLISDIVVNSTAVGRYVSVRTDLKDAFWTAKNPSEKREWLPVRPLGILYKHTFNSWPDIIMCADDQPEDISVMAEFSQFCRPDIIVECMEEGNWYQNQGLEKVKREFDFFKPRMGTFIVSRLAVPEGDAEEIKLQFAGEPQPAMMNASEEESALTNPPRNIHIITAGYEESALNPIIEALRSAATAGP